MATSKSSKSSLVAVVAPIVTSAPPAPIVEASKPGVLTKGAGKVQAKGTMTKGAQAIRAGKVCARFAKVFTAQASRWSRGSEDAKRVAEALDRAAACLEIARDLIASTPGIEMPNKVSGSGASSRSKVTVGSRVLIRPKAQRHYSLVLDADEMSDLEVLKIGGSKAVVKTSTGSKAVVALAHLSIADAGF